MKKSPRKPSSKKSSSLAQKATAKVGKLSSKQLKRVAGGSGLSEHKYKMYLKVGEVLEREVERQSRKSPKSRFHPLDKAKGEAAKADTSSIGNQNRGPA